MSNLAIIAKDGLVNTTNIPSERREYFVSISNKLDETKMDSISTFGAEIQDSLSSQSDSFLSSVRNSRAGEVGQLVNELLVELNYVDIDDLESQSGFKRFLSRIPLVKKLVTTVSNIYAKYDKITNNIQGITDRVSAGIINSAKDNSVLQTIFQSNVNSVAKIEDHIIAGTLKWEQLKAELQEMEVNNDQYQDYVISDKREFVNRLDRRLADLKTVRYILMQSLPQIRLIQNNNQSIADKAQTIVTTTLPTWKNQLTLAVAMNRQKQHLEVQKKVQETTESILRKNAELLKQNTIQVAAANEATIVSLDTLRQTTSSLIDTLNEVKRIQSEGETNRRQLDGELLKLERTLKDQLTHGHIIGKSQVSIGS